MHGRMAGFTLLELLVVITIIAIASAGVGFAMRDSTQSALDREGERLAALLESGRAIARTSGQVVRWRDAPGGFRFEGANTGSLPGVWLSPQTTVRWDAQPDAAARVLTLGPEPIIEPQAITLVQADRTLRLATDGLRPFALQTAARPAP
jgi:general secretion pathway protein H